MVDTPKRRPRRQFAEEFKASAVRLVLDEGKTVGAAARDLDLTETALREWVKRARADRTHGRTGLTTAEREELARLRKENRELRTERDILKKVHPVIELVTATINVPQGEFARLRMFTSLGSAPSNLDLTLTPQGQFGGQQILMCTHNVRVYSDSLIEFNVNRDNAQTSGNAFICISGYLVDA
jgi:transposase